MEVLSGHAWGESGFRAKRSRKIFVLAGYPANGRVAGTDRLAGYPANPVGNASPSVHRSHESAQTRRSGPRSDSPTPLFAEDRGVVRDVVPAVCAVPRDAASEGNGGGG